MNRRKTWVSAILLGVLSQTGGLMLGCCLAGWKEGARMANGSTSRALRDSKGLLYTMHGYERVSRAELKEISLFHALLLFPDVKLYGSGSGIKLSCLQAGETFQWKVGDYREPPVPAIVKALTIRYDGGSRFVFVGAQEFDTKVGNVLLISLDQEWQPHTRQLSVSLEKVTEPEEVLLTVKSAASDDPLLAAVELYPL
jgi:hypothetical protein